jgi:hypothetical protein
MQKKIISLQIGAEQLSACDVSTLETQLGTTIAPKTAKANYGRIFMIFPAYDQDPREVWEVPEVRAWVRRLANCVPHFPFFLVPGAQAGQVLMYVFCLVSTARGASGGFEVDLNGVREELGKIDRALHDFCLRVREHYPTVAKSVYSDLPEEFWSSDT